VAERHTGPNGIWRRSRRPSRRLRSPGTLPPPSSTDRARGELGVVGHLARRVPADQISRLEDVQRLVEVGRRSPPAAARGSHASSARPSPPSPSLLFLAARRFVEWLGCPPPPRPAAARRRRAGASRGQRDVTTASPVVTAARAARSRPSRLVELGEILEHSESGPHRSLHVVAVRDRRAEHGHHRVAMNFSTTPPYSSMQRLTTE
jgi:hypothetical protein